MSAWSARPRRENGAAAVEFALVFPLLCTIFFAIISFGFTYNDMLAVNNAVREGARLGSALDYTPTGAQWASSVKTRVQEVYFNGASSLNADQVCVDVVLKNADGTVTTVTGTDTSALGSGCSPTPGAPDVPTMNAGTCAVRVWVAKPESINWLVKTVNFTQVSKSVSAYGIKTAACSP